MENKRSLISNFKTNIIIVCSSILFALALTEAVLFMFNVKKYEKEKLAWHKFHKYDLDIGWVCTSNISDVSLNSQGIRSNRKFSVIRKDKVSRIALFGDSAIFGLGVPYSDTISAKLESFINCEALNFGVPGYGTDQAFLRYLKDGRKFKPDYVCIGVSLCNDVMNNYYGIQYGAIKPVFKLIYGKCVLYKRPTSDFFYKLDIEFKKTSRLYNMMKKYLIDKETSKQLSRFSSDINDKRFLEALKITEALLDTFIDAILRDGATPIVIIVPFKEQYANKEKYKHPLYDRVLNICHKRNIVCIDGLILFNGYNYNELYIDPYHLSVKGSEMIADAIAKKL